MKLLIKGGRVIDPESRLDKVADLLIENGKIKDIIKPDTRNPIPETRIIDGKGKIVTPGLIDMHVHLREPGREDEETIKSGTRAAAKGGFTTICCMPNTSPCMDNHVVVEFVKSRVEKEGVINVIPIGGISKGLDGKELAEIGELVKAGVRAISDDGNPLMDAGMMRRALEYVKGFGIPLISHCEDINLSKDGVMNEGYMSTVLGMRGIPSASEEVMVAREIILAQLTQSQVHIAHVSTKGSVALIRDAKKKGIPITCETCPHYFVLTDEACKDFNTNTKVNPPLRTSEDVQAIKEGLKDGTIDVISTDHAPHADFEKELEYDKAPFGIVGLETALPLIFTELVGKSVLSLSDALSKVTINPALILGIKKGRIKKGFPADITIIDPDLEEVVDVNRFLSKSRNSPFDGWKVKGIPVMTIVKGRIVMEDGKVL
ncbi:MAG: dihydroorotase [bacterium]|nr:dihydroorotase [bacterium]